MHHGVGGGVATSIAGAPPCLEYLVGTLSHKCHGMSVAPTGQVGHGRRLVHILRSFFHPGEVAQWVERLPSRHEAQD